MAINEKIGDLELYKPTKELSTEPFEKNPHQLSKTENNELVDRLMTSKIVRIRPSLRKIFCSNDQLLFDINTISRIDDEISDNEKETPLFKVEELPLGTCCGRDTYKSSFVNVPIRFQYFNEVNDNKQILYLSELKDRPTLKGCCRVGYQYIILPDIIIYKSNN